MNQDIYQHYGKEEQSFIDQVFGWMQIVENRYSAYLTPFLTPREALIVKQLVANNESLAVYFRGGYEKAERKRALIVPPYHELQEDDFNLSLLNIKFPVKFANISHGKILGTLIGSGIDRERIGDIITDGEAWHVIVDETIKLYLISNVTKIGNVGVHLEEIEWEQILESNEAWETITVISSSLRLDAMLSNVYNFSRQRAKDQINEGNVKMNFMAMTRSDAEMEINDIVSLRKYGRFWIQSIDGVTKKDNYRLTVNVLIK